MKKLLLSTLLATSVLFTQNALAAKCDVKKIGHVAADAKENLVGLAYDNFKIESSSSSSKVDFDAEFFAFSEQNDNLLPTELLSKNIKKECASKKHGVYHDAYQPVFYSDKYNILSIVYSNAVSSDDGEVRENYRSLFVKTIDTKTKQQINFEKDLKTNYKNDTNLMNLVNGKIDNECEDPLNGYSFPESLGIMNDEGKTSLAGTFYCSKFTGEILITFAPSEILPYVKENSLLYKLLNDK